MVLDSRSLNAKSKASPIFQLPMGLNAAAFGLIVSADSHPAPPQMKTLEIYVAFQKKCI